MIQKIGEISAASHIIPAKIMTQIKLSIAERIVKRPANTAKLKLASFTNAIELSQKLQSAICATPMTKDMPLISEIC